MSNLNPFFCRMCGKSLGTKPLNSTYCNSVCRSKAFELKEALSLAKLPKYAQNALKSVGKAAVVENDAGAMSGLVEVAD